MRDRVPPPLKAKRSTCNAFALNPTVIAIIPRQFYLIILRVTAVLQKTGKAAQTESEKALG